MYYHCSSPYSVCDRILQETGLEGVADASRDVLGDSVGVWNRNDQGTVSQRSRGSQ